jgi:hypothetical protein
MLVEWVLLKATPLSIGGRLLGERAGHLFQVVQRKLKLGGVLNAEVLRVFTWKTELLNT